MEPRDRKWAADLLRRVAGRLEEGPVDRRRIDYCVEDIEVVARRLREARPPISPDEDVS